MALVFPARFAPMLSAVVALARAAPLNVRSFTGTILA